MMALAASMRIVCVIHSAAATRVTIPTAIEAIRWINTPSG